MSIPSNPFGQIRDLAIHGFTQDPPSGPLARRYTDGNDHTANPTAVEFGLPNQANTWHVGMPQQQVQASGNWALFANHSNAPGEVTSGQVTALPPAILPALLPTANNTVFSQACHKWQQAGHQSSSFPDFVLHLSQRCDAQGEGGGFQKNIYELATDGHPYKLAICQQTLPDGSKQLKMWDDLGTSSEWVNVPSFFDTCLPRWQQAGHQHQSEQDFLQDLGKQCLQNDPLVSELDEEGRNIDYYTVHPDGHQMRLTAALRSNHDYSHSLQLLNPESALHANNWKPVWISELHDLHVLQQCWMETTGNTSPTELVCDLTRLCQQNEGLIQWVN